VIHGKSITLDEETVLPDGCRVTVHLHLDRAEALRILALTAPSMPEEDIAALEEILSESRGRPVDIPGTGDACASCWTPTPAH
jgi:hypothetical protein